MANAEHPTGVRFNYPRGMCSYVVYLYEQLPNQHREMLIDFDRSCTPEMINTLELRLFRESFHPEALDVLIKLLARSSARKFYFYLYILVHTATQFYQPSTYFVTQDSNDDADVPAKSTTDAHSDDEQTMSFADGKAFVIPREIFDCIVEPMYYDFYLPSDIGTAQLLDFDGEDCFISSDLSIEKSAVLRKLHPQFYEKYKELYWTQSKFIIPSGFLSDTMDFLHSLPMEQYNYIRSVELSFSFEDSEDPRFYLQWYQEDKSLLDNIAIYDEECWILSDALLNAWFWRFQAIVGLNLDHLTLDFTRAYNFEGHFLGYTAAADFQKFEQGIPALKVIAPSSDMENSILDIITQNNLSEDDD